jgi:exo-beta-1,3-glucanase (GH17 family)
MPKSSFLIFLTLAVFACQSPETTQKTTSVGLSIAGWHGPAIGYSGYREGQNPQTFIYPTQAQVTEDLKILEKNWRLIRMYGSDQHSSDVLEVIRREKINLKVMLGAWLDGEPGHEAANAKQLAKCIQLANAYPDVVIAVNVGNEILVDWSNHKVPEEKVIQYVRQVKDSVSVPVTVADDFMFWLNHGTRLAAEVDFVTMHTYPMWGGQDIDTAMPSTISTYERVKQALLGKAIVIGEAGWASYTEGQAHAPRAGDEIKQKKYFEEINQWAQQTGVTVFYFEAFDEPWKGTGTEGHWGLFSVGRKAKLALHALYPDRVTDQPTSPGYDK